MKILNNISSFVGSSLLIVGTILFWPSVWSIVSLVYMSICFIIVVYLVGVENGKGKE